MITIACKNGKFKYTITDLYHSGIGHIPSVGVLENEKWPKGTGGTWNFRGNFPRLKEQANKDALSLIHSLTSAMIGSGAADQW